MKSIQASGTLLSMAAVAALFLNLGAGISPAIAHPQLHGTLVAQSPQPVTYITDPGDPDQLVMQITEGEFLFHGWLERTTGNMFIGEDEQVRVMYDRDSGRIVVINKVTGDEFYNYFFSEVDEGAL